MGGNTWAHHRIALAWIAGAVFIAAPAAGQRMQPTATVTFKSGMQVRPRSWIRPRPSSVG